MKRCILSFVCWALCVFFVCAAGASEYVDPDMSSDAEEVTEEAAETEGDDEEAEPEPRRTTPRPDVTYDVKYEMDKQLQDTGLVFSPQDPREVRPPNGQYRSFPQQMSPFFFVEDDQGEDEANDEEEDKEDDEEGEGEKEDE